MSTPVGYLELVREGALRFAYTSLNAFNLWGAIAGFFGIGYLLHRYEKTLVVKAREALPGPLESYRRG